MVTAAVVMPAMSVPALLLTEVTTHGSLRYLVLWAWAFAVLLPLIYLVLRISVSQQVRTDRLVASLNRELTAALEEADLQAANQAGQVHRREFERRLANALDMAGGESEVIDVVQRSLHSTLPESPVELLLADNSHAHLIRMAHSSPDGSAPCCGVDSPDHCPAARRAQIQQFVDSDDLDACPKLRERPGGGMSGLCVPVSIMGRTVGVIHATGQAGKTFGDDSLQDLGNLAKLAGARIGLLRVMAETQLQATTDNLTGLLNRRAFEQRLSAQRGGSSSLVVAMADLDHFKALNDTYGHETGDRALRLFSQVLTESVRAQDLVCRHGGEEFVVALVACPLPKAREILDTVRARLDVAVTVAGLPRFTVSFGVVDVAVGEDLPVAIGRADAALSEAKRAGRNRVFVHGTGRGEDTVEKVGGSLGEDPQTTVDANR